MSRDSIIIGEVTDDDYLAIRLDGRRLYGVVSART